MVTLFVNDLDQMTTLEYALICANIKYKLELSDNAYGIGLPYIKVYDVPLDEARAFKWIKENVNE